MTTNGQLHIIVLVKIKGVIFLSNSDKRQYEPAVPPLYPMDPYDEPYGSHPRYDYPQPIEYEPAPMPYEPMPCDPPTPMPYEPAPYQPTPTYPEMPYMDCPMMNPRFRECVRVCMMMRCGEYPPHEGYPMTNEYPTDINYENFKYIDLHQLSPYYNPETE